MIKAIFYKEWLKVRWFYFVANVALLSFTIYSILKISRVIKIKGVEHLWEVMLYRDAIFIDMLKYVPLIIGILLAVVQFIPEMNKKCLKLTLHLTCSNMKMVMTMVLSGFVILVASFSVSLITLKIFLSNHFAGELQSQVIMTSLPWYIAGILSYFLVSWVCLEPTWKRRVVNLIISAIVLKIFFFSSKPQAYNDFLPWLMIYSISALTLSWLSVIRFKAGKQD